MIKAFPLLLLFSIAFGSCKYEEGPKISLRTKKHRAVNTWYLEKAFENGVDKTTEYKAAYVDYKIEIKNDDKYTLSYRAFNLIDYSESGTWSFSNDKININFNPAGSAGPSAWKILRLKEHETWVMQQINGKDVELRMKD
jgi:Lipocalin-like domain